MKFIVKRRELETIIRNEVAHIWKDKCLVFSHFWMLALNPSGHGNDCWVYTLKPHMENQALSEFEPASQDETHTLYHCQIIIL